MDDVHIISVYLLIGIFLFIVWNIIDRFTFNKVIHSPEELFVLFMVWLTLWPLGAIFTVNMLWRRLKDARAFSKSGNTRAESISKD